MVNFSEFMLIYSIIITDSVRKSIDNSDIHMLLDHLMVNNNKNWS